VAFVWFLVPAFKGEVGNGDPCEREVRATRNRMLIARKDIEALEYDGGRAHLCNEAFLNSENLP
jgi:hypothetical protein